MSNDFHKHVLTLNCGPDDAQQMMRELWAPTPFMVDAYTGGYNQPRAREIIEWCFDTFGMESSPQHGRQGRWRRDGATVNGWTWYGFATQAELDQFMARWPAPDAIAVPS